MKGLKTRLSSIDFIKCLIILILCNYQVVTVIFKDFIALKYLRDILLIMLLYFSAHKIKNKISKETLWISIILIFCVIAMAKSVDVSLGVASIRKYLFPFGVYIIAKNINMNVFDRNKEIAVFLMHTAMILSIWGIFQAWVLGDEFLKSLGYDTEYSYGYGRVMLRNSFYFGGLGIQRVVSTLSNSNECALIFGIILIFFIGNYNKIPTKHKKWYAIIILLGFLLTFSRSNFVAFAVVVLFILFPYIPYKKKIFLVLSGIVCIVLLLYLWNLDGGIVGKIMKWVGASLSFTDASAAGRSERWRIAGKAVLDHPFGLGFGHVGSLARDAGYEFYACENSYLALAIELGIIGMVSYVMLMLIIYKKLEKRRKYFGRKGCAMEKRLCACGKAIILYYMMAMFFSNYILDLEAMSIMYLCVGIIMAFTAKDRRQVDEEHELGLEDGGKE